MTRNRPINEHIAYLLAQATRQVHQQLDEEFRSEGVPVEQWRILKLLVEKNGVGRTACFAVARFSGSAEPASFVRTRVVGATSTHLIAETLQ